MMDRFWCGAVAGSVNAAFFVTPVEYVRNQLIAQHTELAAAQASGNTTNSGATAYFRGAFCVVRDAYRNQGLLVALARRVLVCESRRTGYGLLLLHHALGADADNTTRTGETLVLDDCDVWWARGTLLLDGGFANGYSQDVDSDCIIYGRGLGEGSLAQDLR